MFEKTGKMMIQHEKARGYYDSKQTAVLGSVEVS
jgi:hypothetical protein